MGSMVILKWLKRTNVLTAIASILFLCLIFFSWRNQMLPETDGPPACAYRDEQGTGSPSIDDGRDRLPIRATDYSATDAAFDFLKTQMDRYHTSTVIYSEPGFSAFYPSGKMGDVDDISVVSAYKGNPLLDRSSIRIDYRPRRSGGAGWAGINFLYPDGNWGQLPGRNVTGATQLVFWACASQNTHAEFFVGGIRDRRLPYFDSLSKVSTGIVPVTQTWRRYEINLQGRDLSSLIGGIALAMNRDQDSSNRSIFLSEISINRPNLTEPRFLQSYVPINCTEGGFGSVAQVYDQALALLTFLARGQADDLKRAELIALAFIEAQQKDRTFSDGRLRNAYASGELIDPRSGKTRIPGGYDRIAQKYLEDENAVGTDTGNMAWAALALIQAHLILPRRSGDPYLNAAVSLADWIVTNTKVNDGLRGFAAGLRGFERAPGVPFGQDRMNYRATEHNIDLEALFNHLADALDRNTPEGKAWSAEAAHARHFVDRMRNPAPGAPHFWTGTTSGTNINKSVIPLDVQTWAILRTRDPHEYVTALDWAVKHCTEKGHSDGFDFNCDDGDGVWWEGTAQVASAMRWLKRDQEAAPILDRLRRSQVKSKVATGAIPAASRCGLTTGFEQTFRSGKTIPWVYPDWPHVAAVSWFIFAELGINPYFVTDRTGKGR